MNRQLQQYDGDLGGEVTVPVEGGSRVEPCEPGPTTLSCRGDLGGVGPVGLTTVPGGGYGLRFGG